MAGLPLACVRAVASVNAPLSQVSVQKLPGGLHLAFQVEIEGVLFKQRQHVRRERDRLPCGEQLLDSIVSLGSVLPVENRNTPAVVEGEIEEREAKAGSAKPFARFKVHLVGGRLIVKDGSAIGGNLPRILGRGSRPSFQWRHIFQDQ